MRWFAGCPICSQHLDTFAARHGDVAAAGITEVVVFHSAAEQLPGHQAALPFADPDRVHYRRFGAETGVRAMADPRAWWAAVRSGREWLTHHSPDGVGVGEEDGTTHLGLPAVFSSTGRHAGRRLLRWTAAEDRPPARELTARNSGRRRRVHLP